MSDRVALGALTSASALLRQNLPDREPNFTLYDRTITLFDQLGANTGWHQSYMLWELNLLEELGFGLDLSKCAATGETTELIYVSPKSGRSVSRSGAGSWASKLLPLPACFVGGKFSGIPDMRDGLRLTGFFLERCSVQRHGKPQLPIARVRFEETVKNLGDCRIGKLRDFPPNFV